MTRKRAPPKRPGSLSNDTRSHPSRSGHPAAVRSAFGGSSEVGGLLRAVCLGVMVGGIFAFLFYPDISRLFQHLHSPSSETSSSSSPSSDLHDARTNSQAANGPRIKSADKIERKPSTEPHRDGQANSLPREKREAKISKSGLPDADPTDRKAGSDDKKGKLLREDCTSKDCLESDIKHRQRPTRNRQLPAKKIQRNVQQDLMEGEEETEIIEEVDSVELELMEAEEAVEYIDSEETDEEEQEIEEGETASESVHPKTFPYSEPASNAAKFWKQTADDKRGEFHIRDTEDGDTSEGLVTEPIAIVDGQPITFTPMSPGDEHVIRLGGRPKANQDKTSTKSRNLLTPPDDSHRAQAAKNDQISSSKIKDPQTKTKDCEAPNKDSLSNKVKVKNSRNKAESKTTPPPPSNEATASKDGGENSRQPAEEASHNLPEEMKNFKPSYLTTVTAKKIFADGRRIPPVELLPQKETNSSVRVYLFNDFMSEEECDGLKRVHDKHIKDMATHPLLCFSSIGTLRKHLDDVNSTLKVSPNDFVEGTRCVNASFSRKLGKWLSGNWSYSTAFYPGESRFSSIFADRVQQAMGLDPQNGGKFQITSYPRGKAYKAHTDCVLEGQDQRDRVATVLVYLDDVPDGGETKFPELDIWVKPRKGRALVWNNMSPEGICEPHSLHVASKVNKGSKYILIRWYYYKSFYSLGKRPPEPPVPHRAQGTPRVSCDDYDNGSCRWYDEWNMDHLMDYEAKKYTLV